ncbi:MAG: hypothetical protein AB1523_11030 [Bacillota bacterium]
MQGMVHLDRQGGKVIDRQLIGNAIVDVHGIEKYVWGEERGEFSGGEYSAVFHLERTAGKWRIAMIDELLEEECREFR